MRVVLRPLVDLISKTLMRALQAVILPLLAQQVELFSCAAAKGAACCSRRAEVGKSSFEWISLSKSCFHRA